MKKSSLTKEKRYRKPIFIIFAFIILTFYFFKPSNTNSSGKLETQVCPSVTENLQDSEVSEFFEQVFKGPGYIPQNSSLIIDYVKKHFLKAPSTLPYNLDDPSKENPSQYMQNRVAMDLLKYKKNGIFIEVGALNGETFSNSLWLERSYNWTGLLVEADSKSYLELEKKNRKAWISHACLSTKKYPHMTRFFYDINTHTNSLLRSSDTMQEGFGYLPTSARNVQCIPLYTYMVALNWTTVDYFSLDVEGADLMVLKTIPFDLITFKVLEVETSWVSRNKSSVRTFLEGKGYKFIKAIWPDEIFAHPSIL